MLSSEEIAKNVCTNPVLIRKVMSKLKKAGIVEAKGGNTGGYEFTADAEALTLEKIATTIEMRFVAPPWQSGDIDKECLISSGMGALMENIFSQLEEQCRKNLRKITVADIDRELFKNKKEPACKKAKASDKDSGQKVRQLKRRRQS